MKYKEHGAHNSGRSDEGRAWEPMDTGRQLTGSTEQCEELGAGQEDAGVPLSLLAAALVTLSKASSLSGALY